ncbi:MAG: non-homologous end-joining DNA ligase [Thermoleophilia bacterium]
MPKRRFGSHIVETSNEDKVLFPESGLTKGDLIDYYVKVSDYLLPLVQERPLTLFRWPDGIEAEGFVQQAAPEYFPEWIPRVTADKRSGGSITHAMAEKAADLAFFADQGTVTLHAWLSRKDRPDHPDTLVFDLDPPDDDSGTSRHVEADGSFSVVRRAARDLRALLEEIGLAAYVKTSGSRGLHITSPLRRAHTFAEARSVARSLAKLLAHRNPDLYTVEQYKEQRKGRLFLDTVRNSYAMTMATAYSVRAKPGAPVAMPLSWDEVGRSSLSPRTYTIENAFRRLAHKQDPWEGLRSHSRTLTEPREKLKALLDEEGLEME